MSPTKSGIVKAEGDLFPTITGLTTSKGVAMNPPPAEIFGTVNRMVTDTVLAMPADSKVALVGIATEKNGQKNVNLALAVRAGSHVEIVSWLGKSWGEPVAGGVAVQVRF